MLSESVRCKVRNPTLLKARHRFHYFLALETWLLSVDFQEQIVDLARTHQDVLGCAVQSILDTERMSCLNCRFMGLRCRKNNRLCRKLLHCWLNLNVATLRLTRQTQRLAEHVCKTIWNTTTLMGFSLDCLSNKSRSEAFVYTLPLKARQYLMGYAFFGPHSISFGPGPGPAPRSAAPLSLWHMGFPAFPFSTLLDFYFSHLFRPFSVTQGPNLVSTWVLGAPYNNSFGHIRFPRLCPTTISCIHLASCLVTRCPSTTSCIHLVSISKAPPYVCLSTDINSFLHSCGFNIWALPLASPQLLHASSFGFNV